MRGLAVPPRRLDGWKISRLLLLVILGITGPSFAQPFELMELPPSAQCGIGTALRDFSDERLMAEVGGRETNALYFTELVYRHGERLQWVAYRMTGNRDDADDIVQTVWMSVLRNGGSFRAESQVKTWLHQILINQVLTERRKASRNLEYAHPLPLHLVDQLLLAPEFDGDRSLDLRQRLGELSDEFRLPIEFHFLAGYTYQEIADYMHIPVGTVRSRISRGLARLQD